MARKDRDRNEVEIDLDKYMALLDQLDEQEDQIKQLKDDARKLKEGVEPPKRKFIDLFLDSNDLNEKAIIGFISFFLMMCCILILGCNNNYHYDQLRYWVTKLYILE